MTQFGMLIPFVLGCLVGCSPAGGVPRQGLPARSRPLSSLVNPFVGTQGDGHTFPGAACPFGATQPSPVTGTHRWYYCAGYQFKDPKILGFSQVHLNGTGCTDLGDVLIQPFAGVVPADDYAAAKFDETASAGYYSVALRDFNVRAHVTCTPRVSIFDFAFATNDAHLLLDLQFGDTSEWCCDVQHRVLTNATVLADSRREVFGSSLTSNWFEHAVSYIVQFDHPWTGVRQLPAKEGEKAPRYVIDFAGATNLRVKVALSTVSVPNARANLAAELPGWDFDATRAAAAARWDALLGRVEFDCPPVQATNLYTALYHLFLQPYEMADVNGEYRGPDGKVHASRDGHFYTSLSLWDTYRAAHPLYTVLTPELVPGFVETMLAHARAFNYLPVLTYGGRETYCMIGNHSVEVIADAYLKGLVTNDAEEAFAAVKDALRNVHPGAPNQDAPLLDRYGYVPYDLVERESVSRTLEDCGDDDTAARFAAFLGKTNDAAFFAVRAKNYRHLFDPSVGFMRPRDAKGEWQAPFDPMFVRDHDLSKPFQFVEGNSWQWTWHVMQDPEGLIGLFGGPAPTAAKLDAFFSTTNEPARSGYVNDVTGYVGQYAHGNEPSHHIIYFYDFVGQPKKAQALVREVCETQYAPRPDGLCGNDDCGQMSAWLLFSTFGFYPFNPVGGVYALGAPQVPRAVLHLAGGRTLTIVAKNLSSTNKYVSSVTLNGKPLAKPFITHREVMAGGMLVFTMTASAD